MNDGHDDDEKLSCKVRDERRQDRNIPGRAGEEFAYERGGAALGGRAASKQALLPSLADPGIYMIKCAPGKVMMMMSYLMMMMWWCC